MLRGVDDPAGVHDPATVRVTLEFERGSDPPRGRLRTGQADYPFVGWVGLATALEHVIGADASPRNGAPAPAGQ
jgi:hypothetical protein